MLRITIPARDNVWDERTESFISTREYHLQLEHSLLSLAKWESKWKKPFINRREDKTYEETIDYIRCMTLTQNVDPDVYQLLTNDILKQINEYINDSYTATTISARHNRPGGTGEAMTAELFYYNMIALQIPFECQKWHLNRLITLMKVCEIKNQPPKKMGKRQLMSRNSSLNKARRQRLNSNG